MNLRWMIYAIVCKTTMSTWPGVTVVRQSGIHLRYATTRQRGLPHSRTLARSADAPRRVGKKQGITVINRQKQAQKDADLSDTAGPTTIKSQRIPSNPKVLDFFYFCERIRFFRGFGARDHYGAGFQPSFVLGTLPGALPQAGMETGLWPCGDS